MSKPNMLYKFFLAEINQKVCLDYEIYSKASPKKKEAMDWKMCVDADRLMRQVEKSKLKEKTKSYLTGLIFTKIETS